LFPVVGGLKDNTYQFEGNNYHLNRHGFARESVFEVENHSETSITFSLETSEATLKVYPFYFKFSLIYDIKGNKLSVTYKIENKAEKILYYSVGAHPAFNVPLVMGDTFTDYYLSFNSVESTGIYPILEDGLIANSPTPLLENTNVLPLTKELFYKDALIFKDLKSTEISIFNSKNKHGITISYSGFPYMGIWSAKDADFVCIEPWCGVADSTLTDGQISNKEGINQLAAAALFEREWYVELF
jgi:galactose mutarotase-like enzyme